MSIDKDIQYVKINFMKYYAVQVKTKQEESYIKNVSFSLENRINQQRFLFPKKRLKIRKQGKTSIQLLPLFPGYIFVETAAMDTQLFEIMRHTKNFYRFLPNNRDIQEIDGKDLELLKHFLQFGDIIDSSTVKYDENDRIVVISGPLQGLEGFITKVDRRKQRAKILIDFANENFTMDLAFELLEKK